jgi:molybdopterin/thiamine biosynthesis adenylyltransferase
MIVLYAAIVLAVAGYVVPLSRKLVFWGFAVLLLVPLIVHGLLPYEPLRRIVGGSLRGWSAAAVVGALAFTYVSTVAGLKSRAHRQTAGLPAQSSTADPLPVPSFSQPELDRYARHIVLREIGGPGQKRLKNAKVLVIGAGGLGSPALLYLAAAGVGVIGVVDDDHVSNSNLQRQIIHTHDRIGSDKVASAAMSMMALNPYITVRTYRERLTAGRASEIFKDYDIVLDGSDNFDTRYMVNAAAVAAGIPLVSAAITQWEGQISLYHPASGGPCYECIFPERPSPGLAPSCAEAGVIAPLPGVLGSMMALEAVKCITGAGATLQGDLLIYDGLWGETRKMKLARRADCAQCGNRAVENGSAH